MKKQVTVFFIKTSFICVGFFSRTKQIITLNGFSISLYPLKFNILNLHNSNTGKVLYLIIFNHFMSNGISFVFFYLVFYLILFLIQLVARIDIVIFVYDK